MKSGGAWATGFFRATAAAEMGVFRNELKEEMATSGDSGDKGCESSSRLGLGAVIHVRDLRKSYRYENSYVQAWRPTPAHWSPTSNP